MQTLSTQAGAATARTELVLEAPTLRDGAAVWALIRDAGGLDLNSPYAYLLLCERFAATSLVARDGQGLAGAVLGLRLPTQPDTLFVWQVAVAPRARRSGLGLAMLSALARARGCAGISYLEAHVGPDNAASEALFRAFARAAAARLELRQGYAASDFPTPHAPERLFRIGPFCFVAARRPAPSQARS